VFFHNYITGSTFLDHIDRDTLNNVPWNLRMTDALGNSHNRRAAASTCSITGIVGVSCQPADDSFTKGRYFVSIPHPTKSFAQVFRTFSYGKHRSEIDAFILALDARIEAEQNAGVTVGYGDVLADHEVIRRSPKRGRGRGTMNGVTDERPTKRPRLGDDPIASPLLL